MKKIKLITLLSTSLLVGSSLPIITTSCNKQQTFTITFTCSSGITLTGSTSVKVNANTTWKDVVKPQVTIPQGYTDVGWYSNMKALEDDTPITSDMTATYVGYDPASTLNSITVKTDKQEYSDNTFIQGGTWGEFKSVYGFNEPDPKEGYSFAGWYVGEKKIEDSYVFAIGQLTYTVEARFEESQHTIKFEKSDHVSWTSGQDPQPFTLEPGKTWADVTKPEVTLDQGYIGVGWYSDNGSTLLEDTTRITKDTTAKYYAIQDPQTLLLLVNLNVDGVSTQYKYVKGYTWQSFVDFMGIEEPEKEGYNFDGWYYGETKIANDWTFPEDVSLESITIDAKFKVKQYTLSFDTDAGASFETTPSSISVDYNTKWADITKPKVNLNPGFVENGWFNAEGGKLTDSTPITKATTAIYRTIEVAKSEVDVAILQGEELLGPFKFLRGKTWGEFKKTYDIKDPQIEGYHFDTWTYDGNAITDDWVFPIDRAVVTIEARLIAGFTKDDWENICQYARDGGIDKLHEVYKRDLVDGSLIGLERTIKINGKDHKVRVIDENHDIVASGEKKGTKTALTFELVDLLSDSSGNAMKSKWDLNNNYSYSESVLNWNLNGTGTKPASDTWEKCLLDMLPKEVSRYIKPVTKKTVSTHEHSLGSYDAKIFTLSLTEMDEKDESRASIEEGTPYKYWQNHHGIEHKLKRDINGNANYYWLSSPDISGNNAVWAVNEHGSFHYGTGVSDSCGVSFAFCI